MDEKFCAQRSVNISEKIYGTAPHFKRLLLIEHPFPWGAKALEESKLADETKVFLRHCLHEKIFDKILLIKKKETSPHQLRVFVVHNKEHSPFIRKYIIRDDFQLKDLDFSGNGGIAFTHPLYLVCTNGKKDQCCSKFGLPIYKQLSELDKHVWQSSHIGGDRFAANVFMLPYGHFYGHLTSAEVDEFFKLTTIHSIYLKSYRGRSLYTHVEQAAEYFLRKELQDFYFDSFKLLGLELLSPGLHAVRFLHKPLNTEYRIVIRSEKSIEKYLLTCKAKETCPITLMSLSGIERIKLFTPGL